MPVSEPRPNEFGVQEKSKPPLSLITAESSNAAEDKACNRMPWTPLFLITVFRIRFRRDQQPAYGHSESSISFLCQDLQNSRPPQLPRQHGDPCRCCVIRTPRAQVDPGRPIRPGGTGSRCWARSSKDLQRNEMSSPGRLGGRGICMPRNQGRGRLYASRQCLKQGSTVGLQTPGLSGSGRRGSRA